MINYPSWEEKFKIETPRAGCGVAITRDRNGRELMFVIGGENGKEGEEFKAYDTTEVWDPSNSERVHQWPEKNLILSESRYSAGITTDVNTGFIYVVGGSKVPVDPKPSRRVEYLNPTRFDTKWEQLPELPTLCGMATGVVDRTLYVIGGATGYAKCPYQRYTMSGAIYKLRLNPLAEAWEEVDIVLPTPRNLIASVVHDDKLYLIGGYANKEDEKTDETSFGSRSYIDVFDPNGPSVSRLTDMPMPLHGASAVFAGDKLLAMGGFRDLYRKPRDEIDEEENGPKKRVYCFDLQSGWRNQDETDLVLNRYRSGACVASNGIFVVGGDNPDPGKRGALCSVEMCRLPEVVTTINSKAGK